MHHGEHTVSRGTQVQFTLCTTPQKNQYHLFFLPAVFFLSAPLYSLISLLWFVIAESLTATVDFPVTWLLQKVRSGRTKRGGRVVIVGLLMGTELCCLDLHLESR